jgi:hypothetical protein
MMVAKEREIRDRFVVYPKSKRNCAEAARPRPLGYAAVAPLSPYLPVLPHGASWRKRVIRNFKTKGGLR